MLKWPVVVPCLVLVILAAPSVTFMLPACQDYMDEIYQPLQALKFFKSHGHAFHKYGPMPNFILAPGYALSLGWWKISGSLGHPTEDFPYGFKNPFFQMTVLIAQTRLVFLVLGVLCYGYLAHTLRLITRQKWAAALAMLFCIATNFPLIHSLPTARPDSPMLAFSAAALAVYIQVIYRGLTLRRAIIAALLIVAATSSKELAATMFVLPLAGLALFPDGTNDSIRGKARFKLLAIAALFGATFYALTNIIYAPSTWLARMEYWIIGPGIDPSIWKSGSGAVWGAAIKCLVNNLGPAGSVVVIVALLAALKGSRSRLLMLALPLISVSLLGVGRIMYPADRFYTIIALALVPLVTLGLGKLLDDKVPAQVRGLSHATLVLGMFVNLWFGTFAWHMLGGQFHHMAEADVIARVDRGSKVYLLNTFPLNEGSSRLEKLGYRQDCRPIQQILAENKELPKRVYSMLGDILFLQHAHELPARAQMIKSESGFDVSRWRGLEPLGYRLSATLVPKTPPWFNLLNWMPAVKEWQQLNTVLVYERAENERRQVATMVP
ncbi:MAG TPA: hypothetical protein VF669_02010 [Tepidisphaeraceae bacterium]|jgi:hypothetical protein